MESLELTVADGLNGVKDIVERSIDFLQEHSIKLNEFGFKLVLFEALNNAIIHGNKHKNSLLSSCCIKIVDEAIIISVSNEGEGFNWREAVNGTCSTVDTHEQLSEGGRGFILYKLYGYQYSFSDDGRIINLQKKVKLEGEIK